MLKDQSFFNLEYELQQRIAAYKVWNTSQEKDEYKRAPIELVDKKLQEWIDSFNAGIKETVKAASSEEVK